MNAYVLPITTFSVLLLAMSINISNNEIIFRDIFKFNSPYLNFFLI